MTTNLIPLSTRRTELHNLPHTIGALKRIDDLIAHYSDDRINCAPVVFRQSGSTNVEVHLDREIAVRALKEQRQTLVDFLRTLGIDADA